MPNKVELNVVLLPDLLLWGTLVGLGMRLMSVWVDGHFIVTSYYEENTHMKKMADFVQNVKIGS